MHQFRIFIIVSLFCFLGQSSSVAQKLTLSSESLDDNNLDYIKVIGQNENGVFVLHSNLSLESVRDRIGLRTRKYKLSFFDFDLHSKWGKGLTPHPENANIETVSFFNGKVVVLQSEWSRSNNNLNIYIDVYDEKGNAVIMGQNLGGFPITRSSSLTKPRFLLSAGKQFAGIIVEENQDHSQMIHLMVCDTSFKSTSQSNISIPYDDKDIEISDYSLSDNIEFFVLAQLREKEATNDKKKLLKFKLFFAEKGSSSFKEFSVNDATHPMTEAAIAIDRKNNRAVVAGFYADKGSYAGAGILFAALSLDKPDSIVMHAFPLNGNAQIKLLGERNAGNSISLFSYPIQKIVLRSDGGAVIVAEAAYLSEYSYYDYFTQSFNQRVEYHYDNVIVLSISTGGVVDWSQVIRKDQTSLDDEGIYASFATILNSDQLVIIYNADIGRNNEVIGYTINNKGTGSTIKFSRAGDSVSLLPRAGKQVDEDMVIVPAVNKKRLYLARLVL